MKVTSDIIHAWVVEFATPEVRALIKAFWRARDEYRWAVTRSCTATRAAADRQNEIVDRMIALGMFPEDKHRSMPTLDAFDRLTRES